MGRYRKKPLEVNAVQWTGGDDSLVECATFLGKNFDYIKPEGTELCFSNSLHGSQLSVFPGQWIIMGDKKGDFYPCDGPTFDKTYEPVE